MPGAQWKVQSGVQSLQCKHVQATVMGRLQGVPTGERPHLTGRLTGSLDLQGV